MKKIIAIGLVVASFAATSSFGQGYFLFTAGKSQVYDGSGATATLDANVDVTFLWASLGSTTPSILQAGSLKTGNNTTTSASVGYTDASAWAAILGSGFSPATNSTGNLPAVVLTASNGGISYNGGANVGAIGTSSPSGTTQYAIFMVGWTGGYSSLYAAAAAGAPVGFSSVFTYTAGSAANSSIPGFAGLAPSFGVFSPVSPPVPEPTTLALAGLSGASLLLFRRRK